MATLYVSATSGNDRNSGRGSTDAEGWANALRTPLAAALACDTYADITDIKWDGVFDVYNNALGVPASALFQPTYNFSVLRNYAEEGTVFCYGAYYRYEEASTTASDGVVCVSHTTPAGLSIECVMLDPFGDDQTHTMSDGRVKTDLTLASDMTDLISSAGKYYISGSSLYVNRGTVLDGPIVVIYRPTASVFMHKVNAASCTYESSNDSYWDVLMPRYVTSLIGCYFCQVNSIAAVGVGPYGMKACRAHYSWHLMGLIGNSSLIEYNYFMLQDNQVWAMFVTDYSGASANPFVAYSGIGGSANTLTLNGYYGRSNVFRWHRPRTYAGVEVAAGSATAYNYRGTGYLAHTGVDGSFVPAHVVIDNSGAPMSLNDTHLVWDMELTNPYFPQPNDQTLVAARFTPSSWGSYAQDLTVRSMLSYSSAYNSTHYGVVFFNTNVNVMLVRPRLKLPNVNVLTGTSDPLLILGETNGTGVRIEMLEPLLMFAGNDIGAFRPAIQLRGTTGQTILRMRNPSIIQESQTLTESIVIFSSSGASATFIIEVYQPLLHSNDQTNTSYWVFAYPFSTSQLPLYSVDSTALVCQNGWYSNMGRFEVTGTQRDTAAEWRTGADGPHDGVLADANGRDALYTDAGNWNSATERFDSGTAYTESIDNSVTLNYYPSVGIDGGIHARRYGAQQFGRSFGMSQLLLDVP